VFGQYLDGLVRVAGEDEFAELAVFRARSRWWSSVSTQYHRR
jgi:hypothetical protein